MIPTVNAERTAGFLDLANRYAMDCALEAESGLAIGSGLASDTTDSPFISEAGKPFLPGSSLRGAMRAHVERIVRSLLGAARSHVLFEPCDPEVCTAGCEKTARQYLQATPQEVKTLGAPKFCPVCHLFGSPLMAARLKIGDAHLTKESAERQPVKRDGVGIDRDTDTAKEHIKYDFEVLERGVRFRFTMQVENAETQDFALLHILVRELRRGLDVGGKRSRGLGRIRLTSLTARYFDEKRGHGLLEYLSGDLKEAPGFEDWLREEYKVWAPNRM